MKVGDKITNRYGGKCVLSRVIPTELMPMTKDGERVDIIFNPYGVVGRMNSYQLSELSETYISHNVIKTASEIYKYDVLDALEYIIGYIKFINPLEADFLEKKVMDYQEDYDTLIMLMNSIISDDGILLSVKPLTDTPTLDTFSEIYDKFPEAKQDTILVPMTGSNGTVRMIESRRPVIVGYQYILRLKQRAEEKFSSTSLSSTNIKGSNSKSKNSKTHKYPISKTPIKFGEMEIGDMALHGDTKITLDAISGIALSPPKRIDLGKEMNNCDDPYEMNVKLNGDYANRNIEIMNAYLKVNGLRLLFAKIRKKMLQAVAYMEIPGLDNIPILWRDPVKYFDKNEYVDYKNIPDRKPLAVLYDAIDYMFDNDYKENILSDEARLKKQEEDDKYI
jgi:hypothetical protein